MLVNLENVLGFYPKKEYLKVDKNMDIEVINENLDIDLVISLVRKMVKNKEIIIKVTVKSHNVIDI